MLNPEKNLVPSEIRPFGKWYEHNFGDKEAHYVSYYCIIGFHKNHILQHPKSYYENFIEQVSLYEKINLGDLGLSCGLFSENYWNNAYRAYYVDCSRANQADLMTPRNINVSFTNNSNVTIDVMIFTEYFQEMTIDVETGLVNK
jgi:hypothetical protein